MFPSISIWLCSNLHFVIRFWELILFVSTYMASIAIRFFLIPCYVYLHANHIGINSAVYKYYYMYMKRGQLHVYVTIHIPYLHCGIFPGILVRIPRFLVGIPGFLVCVYRVFKKVAALCITKNFL